MKLQDYIQHLTALMEIHHAQEFEVKTRHISLDRWGQYDGERVEDARSEQFIIDKEAGIAFVDCDGHDLRPAEELISEYKDDAIRDT